MKKFLTLILTCFVFSSAFAQSSTMDDFLSVLPIGKYDGVIAEGPNKGKDCQLEIGYQSALKTSIYISINRVISKRISERGALIDIGNYHNSKFITLKTFEVEKDYYNLIYDEKHLSEALGVDTIKLTFSNSKINIDIFHSAPYKVKHETANCQLK